MSDEPLFPLRLTTKLVVKFGAGGVLLENGRGAEPHTLQFHDLLAVSELHAKECVDTPAVSARIAARAGVEAPLVKKFLRGLLYTGRLQRRADAVPSAELPLANIAAAVAHSTICFSAGKLVALKVPLALRLHKGEYQIIDHEGCVLVSLQPSEVTAIGQFVYPIDLKSGFEEQAKILGADAVNEPRLREILTILDGGGLLSPIESTPQGEVAAPEQLTRNQAKKTKFAQVFREQEKAEAERRQRTGVTRSKVIPVSLDESVPAALGLMIAYAKTYQDGVLEDFYDFRLDWFWDEDRIEKYATEPAIYLHSNYLWTHPQSIVASEKVKQANPDSITIHGGPDTPKYPKDAENYFAKYPHVDIIIRGEGEESCAETIDKLRAVIGQRNPDLSVLKDVAGITYRYNDEIYRNPDRARIADLNTVPSPYLSGLFDAFKDIPRMHVTLETNRGCPYGCTFCDWGSATSSKIRKIDLERIFGELEWCSDTRVQSVSVADANFGVFERDVAVAEKVGELKIKTGYPEAFGGSFAKNSTKYLQRIIHVMAEADIWTQGVLSLQTMDDATLTAINRSNIKVAKYDALANEMRSANLQLSVELMMALPGSTLQSFIEDLQQCIDRDIQARINHTTLLVNSPMNAPEYMEEHQIKTGVELSPGKTPHVVSTSTFSKEDLDKMMVIRDLYLLLDNFGVLRLCSRFVRQQKGLREMEFILKLMADVGHEDKERHWPVLNTLINSGGQLMAAPYSWGLMIDELHRFLVQELDIADDSALDAILRAQHALLPAFGRSYPLTLELPHDVVEWHNQMLEAKTSGHWQDWHSIIPPLSEFGPGKMEINDAGGFVTSMIGCDLGASGMGVNWDMDSGIGRARVSQDFESAWLPESIEMVQL